MATLTQDRCSPWKKCNLFAPGDSQANKNVEIKTLIIGTHIFKVRKVGESSFKYFGKNQIKAFTYGCTHIHTHTHTHAHAHIHRQI